jgi:hypothetical protein
MDVREHKKANTSKEGRVRKEATKYLKQIQ